MLLGYHLTSQTFGGKKKKKKKAGCHKANEIRRFVVLLTFLESQINLKIHMAHKYLVKLSILG